jgi:hypothetical protein
MAKGRSARRTRIVLRAILKVWGDLLYLHECQLRANRPWEQEGPLRWTHELGGSRLIGSETPRPSISHPPRGRSGGGHV